MSEKLVENDVKDGEKWLRKNHHPTGFIVENKGKLSRNFYFTILLWYWLFPGPSMTCEAKSLASRQFARRSFVDSCRMVPRHPREGAGRTNNAIME